MPPAYVRALFDQYAPKFEAALVDDLGYRGPALLFKAVLSVRAAVRKAALFNRGDRSRLRHRACGARIRGAGRSFHRHRSVATHDRAGTRHRALCASSKWPRWWKACAQAGRQRRSHSRRRCDDLSVRSGAAAGLRRGACWSLAACWRSRSKPTRAEGVILGEGLRYAHSADYVRASIEACRPCAVAVAEDRSARHEDNAPVPGLVVVATKT